MENVGTYNVMSIWYILLPFGIFVAIWNIFPRFGILCQVKSGHPACVACSFKFRSTD
jgi:hypothetical protein